MDNQQQTLQRMQLTGAGDDDYEYESEDEMNDISDQGDGENQKQQKMVMIYGLGKPEDRPPPTYPPGDADKLYTDALLVYVKDFNQNINWRWKDVMWGAPLKGEESKRGRIGLHI